MPLFGLIGYPLSHSFSKKYFTQKFLDEKLEDCRYELFPLRTITELPQLLQNNPDLKGLNVTIPYKKEVLPYLTENSLPEGLAACNCVKIDGVGLTGYNTDVAGFEQSFSKQLQAHHTTALVLGTGGASAAVSYVLKKLGISCRLVSRQGANGALRYEDIDRETLQTFPVVINTTPLGTFPHTEECAELPYEYLTPKHYLFDLVYNPSKTLFLRKGEEKGAVIQNGYEMLVLQAEEAWRIWNE